MTGCLEKSDKTCEICNNKQGYISTSIMSSIDDVYDVCPWCIADGSATKKHDGEFVIYIENSDSLSNEILQELSYKTVSYPAYQELIWLTHCNDGCEFLGHASEQDFKYISEEETQRLLSEKTFTKENIKNLKISNDISKLPYLLKFKCLHCNELKFLIDYD
jgi:uncharacterized protein CbrC (UPF0167 family)